MSDLTKRLLEFSNWSIGERSKAEIEAATALTEAEATIARLTQERDEALMQIVANVAALKEAETFVEVANASAAAAEARIAKCQAALRWCAGAALAELAKEDRTI